MPALLTPAQIAAALVVNATTTGSGRQLVDATRQQVLAQLSALAQGSTLRQRSFKRASGRVQHLLSMHPNVGVVVLSSLQTVVDTTKLQERDGAVSRLMRLLCDRIVAAWEHAVLALVPENEHRSAKLVEKGSVLLLLSLEDRLARVHTGGARRLLSDAQANMAVRAMRPWLRAEAYPEAIEAALFRISRDLKSNARFRWLILTLRRWDALGWLCVCGVMYCFRNWWQIARYCMQYLAVRKSRDLNTQREAANALMEAERLRGLVSSTQPVESESAEPSAPPMFEPMLEEKTTGSASAGESKESGTLETSEGLTSACRVSGGGSFGYADCRGEGKEYREDGTPETGSICGICLESLSCESPFEQFSPQIRAQHRKLRAVQNNIGRSLNLTALPQLAWHPSRVFTAMRAPETSSRKARFWAFCVLPCILAVTNVVGGNKARMTTLLSAVSCIVAAWTWHGQDRLEESPIMDEREGVKQAVEAKGDDRGSECQREDDIEDDDQLRTLQGCGHCFHAACLHRWAHRNPNCPLCRSPFSSTEEDEIITCRPPPLPPPPPPDSSSRTNRNTADTNTSDDNVPSRGAGSFSLDEQVRLDTFSPSSPSSAAASTGKILRIYPAQQRQQQEVSQSSDTIMLYDVLLDDGAVRTGVSSALLLPQHVTTPTALWLYRRRRQRHLQYHRQNSQRDGNVLNLLPSERSIYDLFWEDYWWYSPYVIPANSAHYDRAPVYQALHAYYDRRAERYSALATGSSLSPQRQAQVQSRQARWHRLQQDEVVHAIVRETTATPEARMISDAASATPTELSESAWWMDAWADNRSDSSGSVQASNNSTTTWWNVMTSSATSNTSTASSGGGATGSW